MKVYKFGGASLSTPEGVENVWHLVKGALEEAECPLEQKEKTWAQGSVCVTIKLKASLFVVASAMGKTTNELEKVVHAFMAGDRSEAIRIFEGIEESHRQMVEGLFGGKEAEVAKALHSVQQLFDEVHRLLDAPCLPTEEFDRFYDHLVGYGELFSTRIVSDYLTYKGLANSWIDMRSCFVTDDRHREADIDPEASALRLQRAVEESGVSLFVGQGFIGSTRAGLPTTLGRDGSDYSAAMVGHVLDAESVTIWKDVDGVMNGDPRIFPQAVFLPELTYLEAIELAYSGAQVIHPKTIKPLQNKQIPLYVRPFTDASKPGTVISGKMQHPVAVPIFILKKNQLLVSIRPKDFSFVLDERFADIFAVFQRHRQKVHLIQTSAVNLSICVDNRRGLEQAMEELQHDFRVVYNHDLELLTIRGYDQASYDQYANAPGVFLVQKTRRVLRIVRLSDAGDQV